MINSKWKYLFTVKHLSLVWCSLMSFLYLKSSATPSINRQTIKNGSKKKQKKPLPVWQPNHSIHPFSEAQGIKDKHQFPREWRNTPGCLFICNSRCLIRAWCLSSLFFHVILQHTASALFTVFVIYVNRFHQKVNKHALEEEKEEKFKLKITRWTDNIGPILRSF